MSIRLFRQTMSRWINFVVTKRFGFERDDAQAERMFLIVMSNLVELFGCAFAFFWREEEEMTS